MNRHLDALTGLRFVAAFLVVMHHFANPHSPVFVHHIISHGFVAVSLFFILSGFILVYSYADGEAGLKTSRHNFFVARFARIYPVYLLGFVLYAPFALQHIMVAAASASPWPDVALAASAALALLQSWFPALANTWNTPAWSLSAEAFFYLVFPFVAPLILRLTTRQVVAWGLLVWAASLIGTAVQVSHPQLDRNFWMFNPLVRLPEFLLGMLLGRYWLIRRRKDMAGTGTSKNLRLASAPMAQHASLLSWLAAGALLAFLAIDAGENVFFNGATAPFMMLLIYSLASGRGLLARLLSLRPMILLGEASYSLYLLHWPLWAIISWVLAEHFPRVEKGAAHVAISLALILLASVLSFRFVEQPANRYLKRLLWRRPEAKVAGDLPEADFRKPA